jgi:hypothetical protein
MGTYFSRSVAGVRIHSPFLVSFSEEETQKGQFNTSSETYYICYLSDL